MLEFSGKISLVIAFNNAYFKIFMRILVRGGVQCPTYVVYSKRAGVIPSPLLSAGSEFVDMKKEIFA